jgi:flagellar motility protein MotE (MotC chaperone)
MKQFVILGVVASALFAISSSLSLWLQQTKTPTTEETAEKGTKKGKEPKKEEETPTPLVRPLPQAGTEDVAKLAASLKEQLSQLKEREARLDRRQAENEILLSDVRAERDAVDQLRKQVASELKRVLEAMTELDTRTSQVETQKKQFEQEKQNVLKQYDDVKKKTLELTASEEKNLAKMATVYDSMPADSAAKIFQQLSDSGKMDTAAKLMSQMKDAKAAKVLAEIQLLDPSLAGQLVEKMRSIRKIPG